VIGALLVAATLTFNVAGSGVYADGARVAPGRMADWTRDGRNVVYVRDGDLYAGGDGQTVRLTRTPAAEASPSWSPDGRRVVFERDGSLVVMRLDLIGERRLGTGADPAWSPDGKRVAFVRDEDVWTVGADGLRPRPLTGEGTVEEQPAWSPRGRRIVFVSDVAGQREIHAVDEDGTHATRLTNDPADDSEPAWSPDGKRIAFVRDGAVFTMSANGTAQRGIRAGAREPAWRARPRVRELLPDLDQRAPHQLTVTWWRNRWVLAFASAVDNVGEGRLWLRGARPKGSPLMDATQLVQLGNGSIRTYRDVGFWRYVFADEHAHWHFLPFERYELLDAAGRVLVRDHKSGFCIGDRFRDAHVARPGKFFFTPGDCSRGEPGATRAQGGSSVGYTDRYFPNYHGQNISLRGIPSGIYTLVHRTNPELLFAERRYDNNAASVRIRLRWRGNNVPHVKVLRVCETSSRC
jgi:hypothetical protein